MDKRTVEEPESESSCITALETPYGYWWRYQHSPDEPDDTFIAAIMIAGDVASTEARKRDKTYVVASSSWPDRAVYAFAGDHPDARSITINRMFEFTPAGERIRHPGLRSVTRQ